MGRYRGLVSLSLLAPKDLSKATRSHIPIIRIHRGSNTMVMALIMVPFLNPTNIQPYFNLHQDLLRHLVLLRNSLVRLV